GPGLHDEVGRLDGSLAQRFIFITGGHAEPGDEELSREGGRAHGDQAVRSSPGAPSRPPNLDRLATPQAAQKGPDARRRPKAAREAYSRYVERAAEGDNEADGLFSAAC